MDASAADFIAGSVSGCASIVIGQPFDTIKVRIQTRGHLYRNAIHCFSKTLQSEGPAGLFRGMAPPLATATIVNAIAFSTYAESMRHLHNDADGKGLTRAKEFAAGCFAGGVQCSLLTPAELVKCRLQVQTMAAADGGVAAAPAAAAPGAPLRTVYRGPIDCLYQTARSGGVRGVYQGLGATMAREVPAFGLYFSTYEGMKQSLMARGNSTFRSSMLAGGASGALGWLVLYPIDVAKSKIQTLPPDAPSRDRQVLRCIRDIYRNQGGRYLFRGLGATMVRAFLVNGTIFPVYEWCLQLLRHPISEPTS